MKQLPFLACAITLSLGTALGTYGNFHHPRANNNVSEITDGPFRDGLYLGRLAAHRGAHSHIAIARWATAAERASFTAGYRRGYNEILASRVTPANGARQAE